MLTFSHEFSTIFTNDTKASSFASQVTNKSLKRTGNLETKFYNIALFVSMAHNNLGNVRKGQYRYNTTVQLKTKL